MKQRPLGNSQLLVSEIGLGCWQLGGDWGPITQPEANAILTAADKAGVTFWDTADVYGGGQSERFIGDYTQAQANSSHVIATKAGRSGELYPDKYTRDGLRASVEQSRERLQVETLDLLQLHCIPFSEIKRGQVFEWLDEMQSDGLIANYGASIETMEEAWFCLENTRVVSLQLIFNLLRQDMADDILPMAEARDVGIIVRLGLASGLLSGKMQKTQQFAEQDHRHYNKDGAAFHVGETFSGLPFELGIDLVEQLKAENTTGLSMAELSFRWLLDHSAVSSVITGASHAQQIERNAAVSSLAPLSSELHAQLKQFYRNNVRQHIRGTL